MEEKQSFVFYRSFRDALSGIGDDEKIRIYDAIIDYALDGRETEGLDPVALMAFRLIRPQLDANERRRVNGAKGGAKARECGRLGGNPAFKKGQPNPYYAKGQKAEEEICEESCEETCEDKDKISPEDKGKISPSDCGEDNPKDNPKDNLKDNPEITTGDMGKISPSGERDIPEDNTEDKGKITPRDMGKISPGDNGKGSEDISEDNGKPFEDIPQDNPKDMGKISPSDCGEDNPEITTGDMGKISPSRERDIPEDNPEDKGRITTEDNGKPFEDNPQETCEDNGNISPEDKARATEDNSEISRKDKGEGGRDRGEDKTKGVELDIADCPGKVRDAEKITCEGPEDNPKDKGKISPEDNPEISTAFPADVNINIYANSNERDMSLSGKKSVNVNERETSLSGYRNADGSERETSRSGAEDESPAEAVFQGVPEAAASKPEESADKMETFIERFHIVRDYTGSRLRDVDWEKVAGEYDASEYLATMPRYKSLKWIAYNHLTIEGGCYRPKNAGKRADCVERQKPVEGNPFGDWIQGGGDGDKN